MNQRPLFVFFLFIFAPAIFAQQPSVRRLTIEEAVRVAMQKNSDLQSAHFEVDRADARVQEAWGYAMPSVSLSGRYTRTLKQPVFFIQVSDSTGTSRLQQLRIGSNHAFDAGLTASQILFNGTVFVGVGAASIYSEAARDMFRSKELETVTSVKKSFYQALLAAEARDLMRSSLKNAEDNLRNVKLLRGQGILSEYDELRAIVAVDNLRPSVIQAETNATLAVDGLKTVVGLDASEPIEIIGSMEYIPVDDSLLTAAPTIVLDRNPGFAAAQKQVDVNEAFVMAERSNYLPTIAAFGTYQYQSARNTFNVSTNDFIASSQVGLQLSLSLFQGLQTNARVQQAQVDVRKSQEQLTSIERKLKTGITAVVGSLTAARSRIQAQERTVEQAERGFKIVTTRFLSGAATQLEVNDAELALTQAKVNRIQAKYDYLIAAAELDQLLGKLPPYLPSEDRD
ncbi:MAG: hypothetical protein A3C56_01585 [Ignavibacteria bacterium RIFCSPHIGHO2_02_FULL_56_12]|nr:MAG: hypothetical protein A3C56_01585 [Ignavibacteria bacterium RIFCSPHIGHO2_02_FULL_56_12]